MDFLELKHLTVDCIIGFGKHERVKTQKLVLDLDFFFDAKPAAKSADLKDTVDYVWALGDIRFLLEECQFLLIESAAEAVATYLLTAAKVKGTAPMTALALRLSKPEVVIHGATPTLNIHRDPDDISYRSIERPFGTIDVIYEGKECSLERLLLNPGKKVVLKSAGPSTKECDMIVGNALSVQGKCARLGNVFRWADGTSRLFENKSNSAQSVLCVSRPGDSITERISTESTEQRFPWSEPQDYYLGIPGLYVDA